MRFDCDARGFDAIRRANCRLHNMIGNNNIYTLGTVVRFKLSQSADIIKSAIQIVLGASSRLHSHPYHIRVPIYGYSWITAYYRPYIIRRVSF